MSKATDTLKFLAIHNSWRRGDKTFDMQDPFEIGAAIDDAVNLLRKYDELEKENQRLRDAIDDWCCAKNLRCPACDEGVDSVQCYCIEYNRILNKSEQALIDSIASNALSKKEK